VLRTLDGNSGILHILRVYLTIEFEVVAAEKPPRTHFPWAKVLILKPRVGLTLMMSSPLSFLRIVVFPALSRPLGKDRL